MKHNRLTTLLLITILIGGIGLNLALHSFKTQLSAHVDEIEQTHVLILENQKSIIESQNNIIKYINDWYSDRVDKFKGVK